MTVAPARLVPSVAWPTLELLFEPGAGDELAVLVRALADICRPTAPDHTIVGSARLLSSPFAPEAYLVHRSPVPYAVAVRTEAEVAHDVAAAATCLVTIGPDATAAAGDRAVPYSRFAVRSRQVLPVPVPLRADLRRAHGLPEPMVTTAGRPTARPLGPGSLATALRVTAVADVAGPVTVDALALGAPVVTDAATAEALGAIDGVHVLVADAATSGVVAHELAADPVRAAALGRAGRYLVEQIHDADRTARQLGERLGLPRPDSTPAAPGLRLGSRLTELGTPTGHHIELQLADRLAALGVAPRTAGTLR